MSNKIAFIILLFLIPFSAKFILSIEEELLEDQRSQGILSKLPDELKLQIVKEYFLSPDWPEKAKIKSVFDIDKFIQSRPLTQVSTEFRNLIQEPELRSLLIKNFVRENPKQAVDDLVQAIYDTDMDTAQELIKAGVDINTVGTYTVQGSYQGKPYQNTPLEVAIYYDETMPVLEPEDTPSVKIVEALLKAGANPDHRSGTRSIDETPLLDILDNAEMPNKIRDALVLMLLKAGANPNATGFDEEKPALYHAIDASDGEYENSTVIQYLLDWGANPFTNVPYSIDLLENEDEELLISFIKKSNDEIQQIIINHPYDKLLFNSVMTRDIDTLKQLIEQPDLKLPNFNIDTQNDNGYTALMVAVDNNFKDIAEYLLEHKANPNIITESGDTALTIVQDKTVVNREQAHDKAEMINLLKKYNAQ